MAAVARPRQGIRVPVTGAPPLSAGTIIATAGNGQVVVSQVTAPSGTITTRTLYRSTVVGEPGAEVAAFTGTFPFTDSGRQNGTTLYYTLRVGDGSTYEYTEQVSATPQAAGAGALGNIVDVNFDDGTREPLGFYGDQNAILEATDPPTPRLELVQDPTGGGHGTVAAIKYRSTVGYDDNSALFYYAPGWTIGSPPMYTLARFNLGTWGPGTNGSSDQRKLTYHRAIRNTWEGRSACVLTMFGNKLRIIVKYMTGPTSDVTSVDTWEIATLQQNTWYTITEYLVPNTAGDQANGVYRVWLDGALVFESTTVWYFPNTSYTFDGWYWGDQLQTMTVNGADTRYFARLALSTAPIG